MQQSVSNGGLSEWRDFLKWNDNFAETYIKIIKEKRKEVENSLKETSQERVTKLKHLAFLEKEVKRMHQENVQSWSIYNSKMEEYWKLALLQCQEWKEIDRNLAEQISDTIIQFDDKMKYSVCLLETLQGENEIPY